VAFEALLWGLKALNDTKEPEAEAMEQISQRRDAVVDVCQKMMVADSAPAELQREVRVRGYPQLCRKAAPLTHT
jgi:hypothetical protein